MKHPLLQFSINRPKVIFWLVLLTTLATGALIPNIHIDTDPENMLADDQPERVYHNDVKARFNLYDAIVVGAVNEKSVFNPQSLAAMAELTEGIAQIEGVIVPDLMALSTVDNITQGGEGTIRFEWMMQKAPKDIEGANWINRNIDRLPLLQNTLVAEDDRAAAIYVPIADKDESYRISTEIQALIDQLDTPDDYHITGLPVAEDTFGFQMFVQMGISAPLAALMIFILMWVFFRNLKFVAAPMMVAMATVIITMGVMIGLGFTIHIMSSMIPIFLMPIAVVDSIHIMSEFADNYREDSSRRDTVKQVISHLFKPMLFTSITSAVGFASLILTPIPPVQVFGMFVALGILLAFALTMTLVPAYLVTLKPSSLKSLTSIGHSDGMLERLLPKLGRASLAHGKLVVIVALALVGFGLWGASKIQINDNPVRWFKSDHPIRIADATLNRHFAGTYDAYVVLEADTAALKSEYATVVDSIEGTELKTQLQQLAEEGGDFGSALNQAIVTLDDYAFEQELNDAQTEQVESALLAIEQIKQQLAYFQQPAALEQITEIQQALADSGFVGKTNSLADAVKTVYRELSSGTEADYRIPDSQNGVAQALLQYQSSHRPHDLWHMTTQDYSSTAIWLQLKSGDNQDMSLVKQFLNDYLAENPLPEGITAHWAGKTYLNMVWQNEMVAGMASSLAGAWVVVLLMMIFLFRSLIFGLLAMLPLTVTIIAIYGLIGWIGKDYDMPIAVLSALTLGLSVDFAIHFLQRARDIYAETKDFNQTMQQMFTEPANAISRNAIVISLGFTPLLVAPLMPYVTVGVFLASIMAVSALVTLMVLPVMLRALKSRVLV